MTVSRGGPSDGSWGGVVRILVRFGVGGSFAGCAGVILFWSEAFG